MEMSSGGRTPLARRAAALMVPLVLALGVESGAAQSVLERTPNVDGTWVAFPGVLRFHFLHRFTAGGAPLRRVANKPTFLVAAALPARSMVGVRYGTASRLVNSHPNEWELFGRWSALEAGVAPVGLAVSVGYNEAANSVDGEVALERVVGPVRLLGVGRWFSDRFGSGRSGGALGGGGLLRLSRHLAVGGDAVVLLDPPSAQGAVAWGAALQLAIPTTPHTLSLQVVNTNTATMQGSSRATGEVRYGFEFTIPVTLSRYFGGEAPSPAVVAAPSADTVVVEITDALRFEPAVVRIRPGQTVVWRNPTPVLHTVTADPSLAARAANVALPAGAATFDSGFMRQGAVFSHTFTVTGAYGYVCVPHELAGMVGRVIVEAP